jgi:WD repeat and SOF domain-containing protein 1
MATAYNNAHPLLSNARRSACLPIFSQPTSSAVKEKIGRRDPCPWLVTIFLPIPGVGTRRLRLVFVNPRRLHRFSISRFGRIKGSIILCLGILVLLFVTFALGQRFGTRRKTWPRPFIGDPPTLVYKREDLQRIWQWEIASGHYPSRRPSELNSLCHVQ